MDQPLAKNLIGGWLLARNTMFNLVGQGAPMIVALVAIPLLIKGLGNDRFGVLALAWMVIGYFSLFDLGLGRALTKIVAEKLGEHDENALPALVWTSLSLMGVLGILGTITVTLLSPLLVYDVLKIPENLRNETLNAFYLLACSIPIVIGTAALRGFLEAHQRFDLVNAVRVPLGLLTFVGPLVVLPFSHNVVWIVSVLLIGRLVALGLHVWLCLHIVPALRSEKKVSLGLARRLLNLGSWMTISNIIGPLMVTFDRFLIGALVSLAAVTYYTTPYEVVTKLWVISGAFIGVLFPAFSTSLVQDKMRTIQLFDLGVKYTYIAIFPLTLVLVLFATESMTLWLNAEFAQQSSRVMQLLAVGVCINSLAQVPYALVQGAGRPDITAKLHLAQLPFYLVAVWWLISRLGIEGAAIAWVARVGIDTIVFFAAAYRILPGSVALMKRHILYIFAGTAIFLAAAFMTTVLAKVVFLIGATITFVLTAWFAMLRREDKVFIKKILRYS